MHAYCPVLTENSGPCLLQSSLGLCVHRDSCVCVSPGCLYVCIHVARVCAALTTEPDDLAFIALWKRLMTRKQQLMATSTDADGLRASNQQLRSTINGLHEQLNEERRACQAAVAAKVGVEDRLEEVTKQLKQLQADHEHQKGLLEQQRGLLEQQQELLRKFARQKQAQAAAEQQQQQQPPPQPRPAA